MCYNKSRGEQMRYSIGDVVEGVITGIKPYGAFVALDSTREFDSCKIARF